MPATYPQNSTKVGRMNAVVTDIGSGGKVKFYSAADVLLATCTLGATAGTVGGAGVLTFSDANGATAGILNTTAVAAGTITKAKITNSSDVVIVDGLTVATSGADWTIDNPSVAIGQGLTINSATLNHA